MAAPVGELVGAEGLRQRADLRNTDDRPNLVCFGEDLLKNLVGMSGMGELMTRGDPDKI